MTRISSDVSRLILAFLTVALGLGVRAGTPHRPGQPNDPVKDFALLYTMNPHMLLRGKGMRYTARYPDGPEEVLLHVPHYRFDWQHDDELKEPKRLPKATELVVEAAWVNSALNLNNPDATKAVGWGDQTFHEMFFASYRYIYPDAKAARETKTASTSQPTESLGQP